MGIEKVISLHNLKDEKELQVKLAQDFTDLSIYKYDYQKFQDYCAAKGKSVSGLELVYFLMHSISDEGEQEPVKKNTFNRRYFACKKMLEVHHSILLTAEEMEMIKKLRKQYKSEALVLKAHVTGKQPIPSGELLEMINDIDDVRLKAILLVQFYTGCRPSEMVRLKIGDFDMNNRSVQVYLKKQKKYHDKRLKLECVNAVKVYVRAHNLKPTDHFIGAANKHGQYRDTQISLTGYYKLLDRAIGLSSYVFRKSLVSHLFKNGAAVETIQRQTGHGSIRTIQEHYLKVDNTIVDQYL